MKLSRNAYRFVAVWVMTATAVASAQVIKQVPSDALALLKVSNLDQTSKKIADFCSQMGISQMNPDMQDPLGSFLKAIGAPEGVNRAGELALVYFDSSTYNTTPDKSLLLLIPVADYQKFVGNFPDSKPDGD